MTVEQIQKQIAKARQKILKWGAVINAAQNECDHPNLTGEYGSNTGNWCPQDNSYWLDLSCPDCGKRWTLDSEDPGYRLYGLNQFPGYKCKIER